MDFQVSHEAFSGPIALLYELLQKRELEIKDVSLAKIADEYLLFIERNEVPSEELADFLLIASRLIYLKTKELMPHVYLAQEEEGVEDLEDQLRLYKMFVGSSEKMAELFMAKDHIFSKPFVRVQVTQEVKFVPSKNVSPALLQDAFGWVLKRLQPFFSLQEASLERVRSVEERLVELQDAVLTRVSMKFKEVLAGATSKADVVVSFLALLELVRRNIVRAEQSEGNDIDIQKI